VEGSNVTIPYHWYEKEIADNLRNQGVEVKEDAVIFTSGSSAVHADLVVRPQGSSKDYIIEVKSSGSAS
jgi:hypothetical protein